MYYTLKKNYEFNRVYRKGRRLTAKTLSVHAFKRIRGNHNRLGYAVVRNHGGSVRRNRLKRLLREAYRELDPICLGGYDLILTAKAPKELPTFQQIQKDLRYLFKELGLISKNPAIKGSEQSLQSEEG